MGCNFLFTRVFIKWISILFFWRDEKQNVFDLEAPDGRRGVKSNASF
jgi:hypothetical protein